MPEPVSDGSGQSALDAALRYVRAGFSILPVRPDKRPYFDVLPEGDDGKRHWEHLARRQPSDEEIAFWFRKAPDAGVGIIMGAVSGNAVGLDVDDGLFSNWVQSQGAVRRAWCNLTGSGKVHVIVRSTLPIEAHKLIDERDGRKLADVRGDGEYLVAPPSIHGKSGGVYRVWSGSPEEVPTVGDATALWRLLRDSYAAGPTVHLNGHTLRVPETQEKHPKVPIAPLAGDALQALIQKVARTPSIRLQRVLRDGIGLGEAPYGATDWSQLDFVICKELLQAGWTDTEIHDAYATLPVGANTYRRSDRPNRGASYLLDYTLPAAHRSLDKDREEAAKAAGKNYELLRAQKLMHNPPVYHLQFKNTENDPKKQNGTVMLTHEELTHERTFKVACFRDLGWVVELAGGHKGSDQFWELLKAIAAITEVVYPPRSATEEGQLEEIIVQALRDRLSSSQRPERPADVRFGWRDEKQGVAWVSGHALMRHFSDSMRHPPTPAKVWAALERMGASSRKLRIGDRLEEFWSVPLAALN